MTLKIDRVII